MVKYKLRLPSKEQLIKVLTLGNDSKDNELILTNRCAFVLRRPKNNSDDVVVRHKVFNAGENFVGKDAAKDLDYIESLYCSFLEKWIAYRKNGDVNLYFDQFTLKTEFELFKELDE
ncbi:MAG: hypothetical protein EOP48_03530 [Sphingobacteriales bacterium]|nr:MAG: hypothetical protein EOP48_03530 [Sphingobacteriales bacterium]